MKISKRIIHLLLFVPTLVHLFKTCTFLASFQKKIRNWISPFFTLNKSEQRGILLFSFLIIVALVARLFEPLFEKEQKNDNAEFIQQMEKFYQAQQFLSDSIRIERLQNRGELDQMLAEKKLKPFPFDPNNLPEEQWMMMGFTQKQAKSIKNYEAKGGKFRSKADVKKMYAISEIEYKIIEPYIQLPETYLPESKTKKETTTDKNNSKILPSKTRQQVEINSADSLALIDKLLLSPYTASRVLKYRNLLGGYFQTQQIGEVYGFEQTLLKQLEPFMEVDTFLIKKLDLNKSTFKELLRHPYISYEMTQAIVNKKQKTGKYKSIYELLELNLVSDSSFQKLRPYLIAGE